MGDKYKLMPQLKNLFPENIETFYDVFCGGGSASLNTKAKFYSMNDVDEKIINLHLHLQNNSKNIEQFISRMYNVIDYYGLSLSERGKNKEIEDLKKIYVKTYFSKYNKQAYLKVREDYNLNQTNTDLLYLLLVYGFNHMIRFNKEGKFNLPVGNVDWNKNVSQALKNYSNWFIENQVELSEGLDFEKFVKKQEFKENDFLYFDPPYLITFSDYNKLWNEQEERRLYNLLDDLDSKGIKWGLSNMYRHKGKENQILKDWGKKYQEYSIQSNYISRFDNTIKSGSQEVYITNVKEG
ncbi:DNA adenine methylase [Lactococcus garvieae]|nr:DNA adenine methylase [Lactococcus garvieae]